MAQERLLGPDVLFVHCTFSSEDDLRAIRDSGGSISATPESELQMGMGFPVVGRALRAGVRWSLGCDVVSSNGGDMFTAMRLAMQAERGAENARVGLPQSLPLKAARMLQATTIDAADSIGLGRVIGSLRPGKDADLVVIDATAPNMMPLNRAREGIVMQAHAGNVETVMVRGKPVKLGGVLVGQDLAALRRRLIASRDSLLERAGGRGSSSVRSIGFKNTGTWVRTARLSAQRRFVGRAASPRKLRRDTVEHEVQASLELGIDIRAGHVREDVGQAGVIRLRHRRRDVEEALKWC